MSKRKTAEATVHDRQAHELPINAIVAPVVVDDPFEVGGKIAVARSLRDDPLARMHCRRQIDDAQFYAGRAYQRDWETAERGPQAVDPSKEFVDGGRMAEPLTEQQRKATLRLNQVLADLGSDRVNILHEFLIDGMTVASIAGKRGWRTERWAKWFGGYLRGSLDELAVAYGLAMRAA